MRRCELFHLRLPLPCHMYNYTSSKLCYCFTTTTKNFICDANIDLSMFCFVETQQLKLNNQSAWRRRRSDELKVQGKKGQLIVLVVSEDSRSIPFHIAPFDWWTPNDRSHQRQSFYVIFIFRKFLSCCDWWNKRFSQPLIHLHSSQPRREKEVTANFNFPKANNRHFSAR